MSLPHDGPPRQRGFTARGCYAARYEANRHAGGGSHPFYSAGREGGPALPGRLWRGMAGGLPPEKVFHSVPSCSVSYLRLGPSGYRFGALPRHKWTQMRRFWNREWDGPSGGAEVVANARLHMEGMLARTFVIVKCWVTSPNATCRRVEASCMSRPPAPKRIRGGHPHTPGEGLGPSALPGGRGRNHSASGH